MLELINASPEQLEIWKKWHEPIKNIIHSRMIFNQYKSQKILRPEECTGAGIEFYKRQMVHELADLVKDNMSFKIIENEHQPRLEASIYIGLRATDIG